MDMSRRPLQASAVADCFIKFFRSFLVGSLLFSLAGCASAPRSEAPAQPPSSAATQPAPPPPPSASHGHTPAPHAGHELLQAPAPPPPSPDQQLAEDVANLKKGTLLFKPPPEMKTGQTAPIFARIGGPGVSAAAMQAGLPDQGAAAIVQQTPVSTKMRMTLTGADFTITALSTEEQFVLGDAPTTWEWEIVPKHAGTLNLHLAAVVELDGMSRDYATVDRDIRVKVDPVNAFTTFVQANSVWVLTTLGAAVAALWGLWRKRKKAAASK
jgi:hypothetical protein